MVLQGLQGSELTVTPMPSGGSTDIQRIAGTIPARRVSDNNPYFRAQFKTANYRADFPGRLGSIEDSRARRRQLSDGTTPITATAGSA